jgi:signal peptidase I
LDTPEFDQIVGLAQASESTVEVPSFSSASGQERDECNESPEAAKEHKENEENAKQEVSPQPRRTGFKTALFDILETLLLTIVIYALLSTFIGRFKVLSVSMEPTLYEGRYLLISKQTHKIWPLKRGDILVFRFPRNPKKNYIKRLIGLPEEEVELRNGELYINDELTPEPWLSSQMRAYSGQWQLNDDEYFVMGDNRSNSSDSRAWGAITSRHIIAKALLCSWPVECSGPIEYAFKPTPTPATAFDSPLTNPLPVGSGP